MKRFIVSLSLFVLVSLSLCSIASACPMCKDSIPNGETAAQAGTLPGGFNTSVYIMLVGLFATIGLVSLGLVKGIRSTNARIASGSLNQDPFTSPQSSRGFEVQPSDSSPDETE
jgi:hypothetical protein